MVHCHMEHHMANGMMTVLQYEGHTPTGPAATLFEGGTSAAASHQAHATPAPAIVTPEPSPATPAAVVNGEAVPINLVDDRIDPAEARVPQGTTVAWTNRGADWHSVAAFDGSFASGRIPPGETFAHRFETPGSFQYICEHHAIQGMLGRIDVT